MSGQFGMPAQHGRFESLGDCACYDQDSGPIDSIVSVRGQE